MNLLTRIQRTLDRFSEFENFQKMREIASEAWSSCMGCTITLEENWDINLTYDRHNKLNSISMVLFYPDKSVIEEISELKADISRIFSDESELVLISKNDYGIFTNITDDRVIKIMILFAIKQQDVELLEKSLEECSVEYGLTKLLALIKIADV